MFLCVAGTAMALQLEVIIKQCKRAEAEKKRRKMEERKALRAVRGAGSTQ